MFALQLFFFKNMVKKLILTGLVAFFAGNTAFAQNKNIVVLGSKKPEESGKKTRKKYPSMAVKVSALNFIAGNLPICFEKEFHNFALLVGAGPTFHRFLDNSYVGSWFDEDAAVFSWGNEEMSSVYNPFTSDIRPKFRYSPSYYLIVNPKYYYNEEGMDGGYIGIQYVMSQYSYKNQDINATAYNQPGRDRYTDILLQWGAQFGDNKMIFEWYNGLGVRFKDELRYAYATDLSGNTREGTAQIKKSSIRYDLGIRIGFKF